ncbi:unnamed protein product, partial [Nesidiocoris tenuis]
MSGRRDWFRTFHPSHAGLEITLGNNQKLISEGSGDIVVSFKSGTQKTISNVLYVPQLHTNLLSVDMLIQRNLSVTFDSKGCKIYEVEDVPVRAKPMLVAPRNDGVFKLETRPLAANSTEVTPTASEMVWHQRLAHLNHFSMKLLRDELASGISYTSEKEPKLCESCIRGKHARKPFPKEKTKLADQKLALVHTDLCGPFQVNSWSGARYMLVFLDDHTRKLWVYFLASKDETALTLMDFVEQVETQSGNRVKIIRSDNGGEFVNRTLANYFKKKGMIHQTTCVESPQSNGVAERYMRSIVEKCRSMLITSNSSKRMWAEAANTAAYVINRCPTKKLGKSTPEECWTGKKVDLRHLRVFGCKAFAHVLGSQRKKLDDKSKAYTFVGYSETTKGYRLLDENQRLKISRDVIFIENEFPGDRGHFPQSPNHAWIQLLDDDAKPPEVSPKKWSRTPSISRVDQEPSAGPMTRDAPPEMDISSDDGVQRQGESSSEDDFEDPTPLNVSYDSALRKLTVDDDEADRPGKSDTTPASSPDP